MIKHSLGPAAEAFFGGVTILGGETNTRLGMMAPTLVHISDSNKCISKSWKGQVAEGLL